MAAKEKKAEEKKLLEAKKDVKSIAKRQKAKPAPERKLFESNQSKNKKSRNSSKDEDSDLDDYDARALCDDSDSADEELYEDPNNENETCLVCSEQGDGRQLWFRCVQCGHWVHALCSG